jgi:hypothetical protein
MFCSPQVTNEQLIGFYIIIMSIDNIYISLIFSNIYEVDKTHIFKDKRRSCA